jgi:hypothetical protein
LIFLTEHDNHFDAICSKKTVRACGKFTAKTAYYGAVSRMI